MVFGGGFPSYLLGPLLKLYKLREHSDTLSKMALLILTCKVSVLWPDKAVIVIYCALTKLVDAIIVQTL